eukprot:3781329-Prymnesium_polylepis.1
MGSYALGATRLVVTDTGSLAALRVPAAAVRDYELVRREGDAWLTYYAGDAMLKALGEMVLLLERRVARALGLDVDGEKAVKLTRLRLAQLAQQDEAAHKEALELAKVREALNRRRFTCKVAAVL